MSYISAVGYATILMLYGPKNDSENENEESHVEESKTLITANE